MATYTVFPLTSVLKPLKISLGLPTVTVVLPDVGVSVPVEDIVKRPNVPALGNVTFRMAHAL